MLSVGERKRLQIVSIIINTSKEKENILVIDEPTTHMDVYSKSKILHLINNYNMSLVIVTHDEELISGFRGTIYKMKKSVLGKKNSELEKKCLKI